MSAQFLPYLESIRTTYAKWRELYTLTDATGKQRQTKEVAPTFDFGLMVQTVKKETQEPQDEEKVERFQVLEGIRKYARDFNHVLLVGRPGSGKSTALARLMLELAQEMLPEVTSSNQPTVLDSVAVNRTLTAFERQRLEKRRQNLQTEWDQRSEKLARLRKALAIETQAADKFKLESQIKTEDAAIQDLEAQLSRIEQALSSGTIATLQTSFDAQIPVLVELRAWQTSMLDLIRNACKRHELYLSIAQIETMLDDRQLILLIDGVNELPSEAARTDIYNFQRDYPKVPMIFTTRELSLGGDFGIEQKLEMQPLTEAQMQAFIRSYVPEQAEQMLRQLNDRLREFGQTPLLLWMLCGLFQQTGEIPENLGMVFRLFTQAYERNLKQDVVIESDRERWKPVLQHLAWIMMQGEKPTEFRVTISREEAVRVVEQFLTGKVPYAEDFARKCLRDLQKHHLLQIGTNHEELEFRHQLIQEYYAAEALLEQLPQLDDEHLKRDFLNYLKWTEPIALMLALVDNEAWSVRVVKLALDVDLMLGARLAKTVRSDFRRQILTLIDSQKVSFRSKVQLLTAARTHEPNVSITSLYAEHSSIYRSSVSDSEKSLEEARFSVMLELLTSQNDKTRWSALEKLELVVNELTFLSRSLTSIAPEIYISIDEALERMNKKEIISVLIESLLGQDFIVRGTAADHCGKLGSKSLIQPLTETLKDKNSYIRERAAFALGRIGIEDINHIDALFNCLHDENAQVRRATAISLSEIGNQYVIARLSEQLNHEDSWVRMRAVDVLGRVKQKDIISILIIALNDRDSDVRTAVVEAIGNIGIQAGFDYLSQALDDQCYHVRAAAVDALGKIGSCEAISLLTKVLVNDNNYAVFERTIRVLERIGGENVINELTKLSSSQNQVLHDVILDVLQNLNQRLVKEKTSNPLRLQQAHEVFQQTFQAIDVPVRDVTSLIEQLKDEDYRKRVDAAIELGKVGSALAVPTLVEFLTVEATRVLAKGEAFRASDDYRILTATVTVEALGKIGNISVIPVLIKTLGDLEDRVLSSDPALQICLKIVEVLGNFGSNLAVPILMKILRKDRNTNLSWTVAQALGKLEGAAKALAELRALTSTLVAQKALLAISGIQSRIKYYNYEVFQAYLEAQESDRQKSQNSDRSSTPIYNFPSATEVKIFENVDRHHETPPKDPP
jgi:HEAT repeat protein